LCAQRREIRSWQAGERKRVVGHVANAAQRGGSVSSAIRGY
jgi:hypothetical protein